MTPMVHETSKFSHLDPNKVESVFPMEENVDDQMIIKETQNEEKDENIPSGKNVKTKKKNQEKDDLYRDRAEERRDGVNMDYSQYVALQEKYATVNTKIKTKKEIEEEIKDSKVLGGTLESTHLVKGLDYVLLQKVKNQIEEDERKKEEEESKKKLTDKKRNKETSSTL